MSTRKIKTSELTSAALDWAVAKVEGDELAARIIQYPKQAKFYSVKVTPSTDWSQGGPIIERENITIIRADDAYVDGKWVPSWFAETSQWVGHTVIESYEHQCMDPTFMISAEDGMYGPTPLIAAMRCYVASKLGDTVEIPEEILS